MASELWLILYFGLWAVAHSLLASLWVKREVRRFAGPATGRWYRLAFNVVAALTVLPFLAMIVLLPSRTLYVIPWTWRWLTLTGQALALAALVWTVLQTSPLHFAGLAQLWAADPERTDALQTGEFYCHMRHPLYFFSMAFLWLTPVMTANIATANVLMSLYFLLGSIPEERKLLVKFGEAYAAYRRRVPRLFPRLRPCPRSGQEPTSQADRQAHNL